MESIELLQIIQKGESSTVQFKERVIKGKPGDAYDIAVEMVAFSNAKGGLIIIGVNDKTGALNGLSFQEIEATNELLSNAASDNVKTSIIIFTEQVVINGQILIVVQIKEGNDKPYKDNKGIIWIKNGSDKRKVTSNQELLRLLQNSGNVYADEAIVNHSTLEDIDEEIFKEFIYNKFFKRTVGDDTSINDFIKLGIKEALKKIGANAPLPKVLKSMVFSNENNLTLAGLLFFGKNPQHYKPFFSMQCVSYVGNDIAGTNFRDSEPPFEGSLKLLFEKSLIFLKRNLKSVQVAKSFNSLGELEIPQIVLEELLVNALVHRDYFINSTVKVLMFDNRIEIISPGKIPNSLTIENIINGQSLPRNPILHSNAQYLLPYRGLGSGIPRALDKYKNIEFQNNEQSEQFKAIIHRTV